MEITVNQQCQTITDNCSLQQLLNTILPGQQKGMAIAVNNTVIPKSDWESHLLQPNDTIILITATQGG